MTTEHCFSRGESQFIFKAVGDVLLEIQNYISSYEPLSDSLDSEGPELGPKTLSRHEKCIRFASNKTQSAEDILPSQENESDASINHLCRGDINRSRSNINAQSEYNGGKLGQTGPRSPKPLAKGRQSFKIESFFTFGRHNQILIPSSEILILSLIYIDRFIKNKGLEKFDIAR